MAKSIVFYLPLAAALTVSPHLLHRPLLLRPALTPHHQRSVAPHLTTSLPSLMQPVAISRTSSNVKWTKRSATLGLLVPAVGAAFVVLLQTKLLGAKMLSRLLDSNSLLVTAVWWAPVLVALSIAPAKEYGPLAVQTVSTRFRPVLAAVWSAVRGVGTGTAASALDVAADAAASARDAAARYREFLADYRGYLSDATLDAKAALMRPIDQRRAERAAAREAEATRRKTQEWGGVLGAFAVAAVRGTADLAAWTVYEVKDQIVAEEEDSSES